MSGTGLVNLGTGANFSIAGAVAGSLAFNLAPNATLALNYADAAASITLSGRNVLEISDYFTPSYTLDMQAVITGLDASDLIWLNGGADGATYVAGPAALPAPSSSPMPAPPSPR